MLLYFNLQIKKHQQYLMSSSFFFTFDCTDPEKQKLIKGNQISIVSIKKTKILNSQKLAFSFKEKKYVHKHHNAYKSFKNIDQNLATHHNQRRKHKELLKTLLHFCISKQVQQTINPYLNKPQKAMTSIQSSFIQFSIPDSQQGIFQKDNLRSTQETQLRGAQSTLYESQKNPHIITWKKENQNSNISISGLWKSVNLGKIVKGKQKRHPQLLKGRSEAKLLKLEQKQERPFSSMFENNRTSFKQIEEKQYKISTDNLQRSKADGKKKKLDEMEIRSICSIKEESSGDDFSEVIAESRLNLGKRHFSLEERLFKDFS